MREYMTNFAMIVLSFSALFLIFTSFELVGDIIRNRTPLVTVGDYLINLIPFILYNVTPLCALVAVLVTFGALNRSSELTAMKATGISLYRIITPVLFTTLLIAGCLFAFDELYLPTANRRQEALRSIIKDKPAQTFLRPDRKWISGQAGPSGSPTRIFYYQFFDASRNVFANLTVFESRCEYLALKRRILHLRRTGTSAWVSGSLRTAGSAPSKATASRPTNPSRLRRFLRSTKCLPISSKRTALRRR